MGALFAVIAFVAVLVVAIIVARSPLARRVDDRVYESKAGWLMPGGIFWKLGRRDRKPGERFWPYLFDPINGWMYNAGRERRAREQAERGNDEE